MRSRNSVSSASSAWLASDCVRRVSLGSQGRAFRITNLIFPLLPPAG